MFFELLSVWWLNLETSEKNYRFLQSNAHVQPCTIAGILYRLSVCPFFNSAPTYHPKGSLCFLRYIGVLIKYMCVYVLVCVYIYHMFAGTLRPNDDTSSPEPGIIDHHKPFPGTKYRSSGSKWSYPLNHLPTFIRYHFLFCYPQELPISFSQHVFSSTHSSNSLPSCLLGHDCLQQFLRARNAAHSH